MFIIAIVILQLYFLFEFSKASNTKWAKMLQETK